MINREKSTNRYINVDYDDVNWASNLSIGLDVKRCSGYYLTFSHIMSLHEDGSSDTFVDFLTGNLEKFLTGNLSCKMITNDQKRYISFFIKNVGDYHPDFVSDFQASIHDKICNLLENLGPGLIPSMIEKIDFLEKIQEKYSGCGNEAASLHIAKGSCVSITDSNLPRGIAKAITAVFEQCFDPKVSPIDMKDSIISQINTYSKSKQKMNSAFFGAMRKEVTKKLYADPSRVLNALYQGEDGINMSDIPGAGDGPVDGPK